MKRLPGVPAIARLAVLIFLSTTTGVRAQSTPPSDNPVLDNPNLDEPSLEDLVPPDAPNPDDTLLEPVTPEVPPALPPEDVPDIPREPPSDLPSDSIELPSDRQFRVRAIELLGVSLSPEAFGQLEAEFAGETVSIASRIAAVEGQLVTLEDLLALRAFITDAYVNAGYITSGAFLPEQTFEDGGVVRIQVIEGILETVEVAGLTRLQADYVRSRMQLRLGRPLQQGNIVEALQLLQLDPLIDSVDAELQTGSGPGLSILALRVEEAPPLTGGFTVNNYRSPSAGSEQINPYVSYTNLLGLGDRLDLSYSLTRGLNDYTLNYTIPISPHDGTLTFRAISNNSRIIEDEFDALDIRGESSTFSLGVRQPLIKTPSREFALGLALDLRRSQTFVFDDRPFSFAPGPEDGESKVTVLRFSQDWVDRTPDRVLAARSQFSFGLNAFDATTNETAPDGEFFSWLGQLQWVQRLPEDQLLVARLSAQLTPDALLPLEQFSLGGVNTVRGYRENQLVTDNGVIGSLELRVPLSAKPGELELTPFVEGGIGWDNGGEESYPEGLASVGLGLRWQVERDFSIRLDYGYPLIDVDQDRDTLQEQGVYLSFNWTLDGQDN
ncbi:MAG: ShlB/FhaC/HecB family hemolysin secretion/activation protein [Cyanobacteria bacterium J06626_18]